MIGNVAVLYFAEMLKQGPVDWIGLIHRRHFKPLADEVDVRYRTHDARRPRSKQLEQLK